MTSLSKSWESSLRFPFTWLVPYRDMEGFLAYAANEEEAANDQTTYRIASEALGSRSDLESTLGDAASHVMNELDSKWRFLGGTDWFEIDPERLGQISFQYLLTCDAMQQILTPVEYLEGNRMHELSRAYLSVSGNEDDSVGAAYFVMRSNPWFFAGIGLLLAVVPYLLGRIVNHATVGAVFSILVILYVLGILYMRQKARNHIAQIDDIYSPRRPLGQAYEVDITAFPWQTKSPLWTIQSSENDW